MRKIVIINTQDKNLYKVTVKDGLAKDIYTAEYDRDYTDFVRLKNAILRMFSIVDYDQYQDWAGYMLIEKDYGDE